MMATMTMDMALVAAARFGGAAFCSDRIGPCVIGRGVIGRGIIGTFGLSRGGWRHADIETQPAPRR
jgi:hypothetical protein